MTALRVLAYILLPSLLLLTPGVVAGVDTELRAFEGAFQPQPGSPTDDLPIVIDSEPPEVEITSPAFGSTIAGNAVTVSGTVSDDELPILGEVLYRVRDASDVTLDEGRAAVTEGRFTIVDALLGAGEHRVEVLALDLAGNEGFAERTLVSDPDAPPVTLVDPLDGQAVLASQIDVALNFAAPTTLVSVNGSADGRTFPAGSAEDALALPLALGANTTELVLDAGDGPFSFAFTIFRVESAGPIRIRMPTDGVLTNQEVVTVAGTVPRGTPAVTVNGEPATLGPDRSTFSAGVPLEEGKNTLRAVAFPFGQVATVEVTRDTVPPTLGTIFPGDGTLTVEPSVGFAGFASESGRIEVSGPSGTTRAPIEARLLLEGNPLLGIPPLLEFVFELDALPLVEGMNAIEVRLEDRAGNETLETLTVTRSDTALQVVSPADGSSVPDLRADLVLDVLADVTIESVLSAGRRLPGLDGLSIPSGPAPPGQFTLGLPLAPGPTELRIVYRRDATGQQEILRHTLVSSAADAATVTGTVRDSGSGEPLESALVSVLVNGTEYVVPTDPDGTFAVDVESGDVSVRIESEGFFAAGVTGTVAAGETLVADAELFSWDTPTNELPPADGEPDPDPVTTLLGAATDAATGEPLEGVLVTVQAADGAVFDAVTDAAGAYMLEGIPSGALEGSGVLVGYFPELFEATTTGRAQIALDFALDPIPEGVVLAGTVLDDASGAPVPDMGVEVLGTELQSRTDAEGHFVIESFPFGEQTLRFRRPGLLDSFWTLELFPQPGSPPVERTFPVPLEQGTGLRAIAPEAQGRVLERFRPVALPDAVLEAVPVGGGTAVTAEAQADGSFLLSGLEIGGQYEVTATAPGHEPETEEVIVVPNAAEDFTFRLRSTGMGNLTGIVRSAASGAPLFLAHVRVEGAERLVVATDSEGRFTLPVPPGTHDLAVSHPAHVEGTLGPVTVGPGETVELSVDLASAPTTGGLEGAVTDASTGHPIAGATLELPDGRAATAAADGTYTLSEVPAGLIELTIEAPGYPATSRIAAVVADPAPGSGAVSQADFQLTVDGSEPPRPSQLVEASEGGIVTDREGRLVVAVLPGSLSADARVTVRPAPTPSVASGELLSTDPALRAGPVRAVGGEVELFVEPAQAGGEVPSLDGPAVLLTRYDAAEAEAQGVAPQTLAPYFFDGSQWTLLRLAPHLHFVDETSRFVLTGVTFEETELASRVSAPVGLRDPVQLASVDPSLDLATGLVYRFVLGALPDPAIKRIARLKDYLSDFEGSANEINLNARPLLVVHGWDTAAIVRDSDPLDDPLDPQDGDNRYAGILRDLVEATSGVYRPVFATYNSRVSVLENGTHLGRQIFHRFVEEGPEQIRGNAAPGNTGTFEHIDAFGFSMGSLTTRAIMCGPGLEDAQPLLVGPPLHSLVTMGGPHHGGLQRVSRWVEEILQRAVLGTYTSLAAPPREFIRKWSPGTADLLEYETLDENPTLFLMNETLDLCAPQERIALVGGTDSGELPPGSPELLSGRDLVGELPNDSVVALRSAHAEKPSGATVPALAHKVSAKKTQFFNHFDVGKRRDDPDVESGRAQPISDFIQADILPFFTDWTVSEITTPLEFQAPTQSEPGFVRFGVDVHFNAHGKEVGAVALVFYGKDVNGNWHILHGASPETREPSLVEPLSGNSRDPNTGPVVFAAQDFVIPVIDPTDSATQITEARPVVISLPRVSAEVPPDPTDVRFQIPVPSP